MKGFLRPVFLFCLVFAAPFLGAFEQRCDYNIRAVLDADRRALTGSADATYRNASPDTLSELYFELYPNAFREGSKWWTDSVAAGSLPTAFPKGRSESKLEVTSVTSGGNPLRFEPDAATHGYYLRVKVPGGLAPGASLELDFEFRYTIPETIERGGFTDGNYHLIRWYPVAAQYDGRGWHLNEHRPWGEFSGTYGNYTVELTAPEHYVVAASGVKTADTSNGDGTKTETYVLRNAHNFAFCADTRYRTVSADADGIPVTVYYFFANGNERVALEAAVKALRHYGDHYGPYAYEDLDVVQAGFEGGAMEYPGLMMLDRAMLEKPAHLLDRYLLETGVMHETGHMWWYAAVGNNETEEAWLDEGLNSFCELRYLEENYGAYDNIIDWPQSFSWLPNASSRLLIEDEVVGRYRRGWGFPIETPAAGIPDSSTYITTAYRAPALLIDRIRDEAGAEAFDEFLREYYRRFLFRHPTGDDFFELLSETTGRDWSGFRAENFTSAATPARDFIGLNRTYRGGVRWSLLPDFPDGDETVFSALPVPWIDFHETDDGRAADLGAGLLFYGKHRLSAGFTAMALPYWLPGADDPFGLVYAASLPLYLFEKPVKSQSLSVSGTLSEFSISLDTGFGAHYRAGYPAFDLGLDYMFGEHGHEAGTRAVLGLSTPPVVYNLYLNSAWYPRLSEQAGIEVSTPVFFSSSLSFTVEAGWSDSPYRDELFTAPDPFGISDPVTSYARTGTALTIPLTGRLHVYLLREFLIWNGIQAIIGAEAFLPGAAALPEAWAEDLETAIHAELPLSFSLFGLPFGFCAGPAVVWRPGTESAFDFGAVIGITSQGVPAMTRTVYAADLPGGK